MIIDYTWYIIHYTLIIHYVHIIWLSLSPESCPVLNEFVGLKCHPSASHPTQIWSQYWKLCPHLPRQYSQPERFMLSNKVHFDRLVHLIWLLRSNRATSHNMRLHLPHSFPYHRHVVREDLPLQTITLVIEATLQLPEPWAHLPRLNSWLLN